MFCKFPFFLKLENGCTKRSRKIECRYIVLSYKYSGTQSCFHLLLLLARILLEIMTLMCKCFLVRRCTAAGHVSCEGSRLEAWNAIYSYSRLIQKCVLLIFVHLEYQLGGDSSHILIYHLSSIGIQLQSSIKMPFYFVWIPVLYQSIHHLETYYFMTEG